jgi:uncharacterized protein YcaQ
MSAAYPLEAIRAVILYAQGLDRGQIANLQPTPDDLYAVVERLGCIQIDTLQMVHRSHYLTLWSRLGSYDPAHLDYLAYDPNGRRLFEYWKHAACLIPLNEYRDHYFTMERFRSRRNWREWLAKPENTALTGTILERIRAEGGLRTSDFDHNTPRRGGWWDWTPTKTALESLFNRGELMVARRVNFQRVYDLPERVLPEWVDRSVPPTDEALARRVEQAARALGVFQPPQAAEYTYLNRTTIRKPVEALIQDGRLVPIRGRGNDGNELEWVIHRDLLSRLAMAADGSLPAERTTFLSPFDSLFWARGRDEQIWGFHSHLEAYTPAHKRVYGYFSLPILQRGRLVGRFDPKLDRRAKTITLRALHLEPGVAPDEQLTQDFITAMKDFMVFHQARDLIIQQSNPAEFGAAVSRLF